MREGAAINAPDKNLEGGCWSPIDSSDHALDLIAFLGKLGADNDLKVAYLQAETALAHNPDAPVSGWRAIEETFGPEGMRGIRRAMKAGSDIPSSSRWPSGTSSTFQPAAISIARRSPRAALRVYP